MSQRTIQETHPVFAPATGSRSQFILVVDDEPSFSAVLGEILRSFGYYVQQANSVASAMEIIKSEVPDLILTDVMMPGTDGLSFIRDLQADPHWSAIPTVVISAKSQPSDIEESKKAGADDWLIKPFSALELRNTVQTYLKSNN
jgi:CheY-like chemotaxis protein